MEFMIVKAQMQESYLYDYARFVGEPAVAQDGSRYRIVAAPAANANYQLQRIRSGLEAGSRDLYPTEAAARAAVAQPYF